jgi:hypothetical protein
VSIARWNLKEARTAKRYTEEHEAHMRQSCWVRRQKSLKPDTDTEDMAVYATVLSAKGVRITRGDLTLCMKVRREERCEKSAEGIVIARPR